jgi:tetratricopeptide (TPR) repeat protein
MAPFEPASKVLGRRHSYLVKPAPHPLEMGRAFPPTAGPWPAPMKALFAIRDLGPAVQARLCAAMLFLLVAAVFLPAVTDHFITYDDPVYVTENAHVTGGLTWENVRWAFTSTEASNWHPLTWISHMADCQLFGLRARGHHLTSVLLHAMNSVLLFLVLRRMSHATWRSLFVAALFGLHPLHVESVAWISERKDVLSTTFGMLVLWAYARRAELAAGRRTGTARFYALAMLFFALGLMCKQMLVTLPCVLLLLDYWPLGRFAGPSARSRWFLLAEKIPFVALSIAASAVTLFAQASGGAVATVEDFPWSVRIGNALVTYCGYLGKCFAPARLAIFYPSFAESPPLSATLMAGALVVGVTATSVILVRRRPYLLVGWLWFVGTLVPVIGLVQVGGQSMADRYTYVPMIGVFIMVAWGAVDASQSLGIGPRALSLAGCVALVALCAVTIRQLGYWRDGARLFRHAAAVTDNNWVAHANLYATLSGSSAPEAGAELQETTRILAAFADKYDRKGAELERKAGHLSEAIREYRTAVRIMPDLPGPHDILGMALAKEPGGLPEAIGEFRAAVALKPDFAGAHYNLGTALAASAGGKAEAITEYETVTLLDADNFQAHYNLAFLLSGVPGREGEAVPEYEAVIRLRPDFYQARFNLGLLLAGLPGRKAEAIEQFKAVLKARPGLEQARKMIDRLQADPR